MSAYLNGAEPFDHPVINAYRERATESETGEFWSLVSDSCKELVKLAHLLRGVSVHAAAVERTWSRLRIVRTKPPSKLKAEKALKVAKVRWHLEQSAKREQEEAAFRAACEQIAQRRTSSRRRDVELAPARADTPTSAGSDDEEEIEGPPLTDEDVKRNFESRADELADGEPEEGDILTLSAVSLHHLAFPSKRRQTVRAAAVPEVQSDVFFVAMNNFNFKEGAPTSIS